MYSAVGRVIMYSGALGDEDIMQENIGYSERMTGPELATALVEKTKMAKAAEVRYEIKSTCSLVNTHHIHTYHTLNIRYTNETLTFYLNIW